MSLPDWVCRKDSPIIKISGIKKPGQGPDSGELGHAQVVARGEGIDLIEDCGDFTIDIAQPQCG